MCCGRKPSRRKGKKSGKITRKKVVVQEVKNDPKRPENSK